MGALLPAINSLRYWVAMILGLLVISLAQPADPTLQFEALQVQSAIYEGETLTAIGVIGDTGEPSAYSLSIDWGSGITTTVNYPAGTTVFTETQRYDDDHPTNSAADAYLLTFSLEDESGNTATGQVTTTVINVAPLIAPLEDMMLVAGEIFTRTGEFSDPGADDWAASVNFGEGAGWRPLVLEAKVFTLSHLYRTPGVYHVSVRVIDDDNGLGENQFLVTVMPPRFRLMFPLIFKYQTIQ